ncbi:hypothetical protein SAMN02799624_04056 [Paenibacillus sp. UNC496MF]|uniref:hypothetical protein n=1 Tax=Paenibacillus sp. UNC496MF TaxID=1502753 RepID=UPI0008ED593D|nr:hypothetical protein [Paenibacillus sp. UNC496MF]SFJ32378.1 hypothetical protein SAMN02799624_04056 [Paenibacillus sp. UNC496MF]
MTSSRNHQEAHGIGQAEAQLNRQAKAAAAIQGANETDQAIMETAERDEHTSLDEVIDAENS